MVVPIAGLGTLLALRSENPTFWQLKESSDLAAALELPSLNMSIPLIEVYEGVKFYG